MIVNRYYFFQFLNGFSRLAILVAFQINIMSFNSLTDSHKKAIRESIEKNDFQFLNGFSLMYWGSGREPKDKLSIP